jgi:peptidoglycan hydrolase-like protein with peptidoglycan-binding domain
MLKRGDSGLDVKTLQIKLKLLADGQFGPITEKAVIRFQLSNNLPVNGIVESDMWVLMFNLPEISSDEIDEDTDISENYFRTSYDQLIHKYYLSKKEYISSNTKNEYVTEPLIIGGETAGAGLPLNLS